MWELDHEEGWAPKNWCFWTVVLEKTLESPLDSKIKPVDPNGNQSWMFIWVTDAEAKAPILWPPDAKNWLMGKDPDTRKEWRWEEKGKTEDQMVGWHHQLDGHEFEQAPGDDDRQGGLSCYCPLGSQRVGHDWVTELNWRLSNPQNQWQNWRNTLQAEHPGVMSKIHTVDGALKGPVALTTIRKSFLLKQGTASAASRTAMLLPQPPWQNGCSVSISHPVGLILFPVYGNKASLRGGLNHTQNPSYKKCNSCFV